MAIAPMFVIVVEFCERLCFYAFQGSMKAWLQDQGYTNASSSSMSQVFALLAYVSCFLGGWMAETRMGRYRTIWSLIIVYVIGCYLAAVAVKPGIESVPLYLIGTFVLIALGTGGIKPNVATFGADQFDPNDPDSEQKKSSFFMYFYMVINVGALISLGGLATVATSGMGSLIAKEDGYFAAFLIAAGSMTVAFFVYMAATPLYRKESLVPNQTSILSSCTQRMLSAKGTWQGKLALFGWLLIPLLIILAIVNAFVDTWYTTALSLLVDVLCIGSLCVAHNKNDWLGDDEFTKTLDAVPPLMIGNISFNVLYNSMSGLFYSESCQMDTRIGGSYQLSGAFFNLGDCFGIILFTPIIDKLCLPWAQKLLGRPVSLTAKVYTGIAFGMAAQLVAAGLEYARKDSIHIALGSHCAPLGPDGSHVHMSDISAFWMLIPYLLIGIGEIFVNPVLQHFAYADCDPSMRSLMQAFNMFCLGGLPNAISSALTAATSSFVTNDLDDGNLPVAYYINVVIGLLGCALFWAVTRGKKDKSQDGHKSSEASGDEKSEKTPAADTTAGEASGQEEVSGQAFHEEKAEVVEI